MKKSLLITKQGDTSPSSSLASNNLLRDMVQRKKAPSSQASHLVRMFLGTCRVKKSAARLARCGRPIR